MTGLVIAWPTPIENSPATHCRVNENEWYQFHRDNRKAVGGTSVPTGLVKYVSFKPGNKLPGYFHNLM